MIAFNFRDSDNQLIDTFSSDTLSPLFADQRIDPQSLFPAPGQITHDWHADHVISALQSLYQSITPKEIVLPGQSVTKLEKDLTPNDKAAMLTTTVTHGTMNGDATVTFVSPDIEEAPAPPAGYSDLNHLIILLEQARNGALQLETISL